MPDTLNDDVIVTCECGARIPKSRMEEHKGYHGTPFEIPPSQCSDAYEPWMGDNIGSLGANLRLEKRILGS